MLDLLKNIAREKLGIANAVALGVVTLLYSVALAIGSSMNDDGSVANWRYLLVYALAFAVFVAACIVLTLFLYERSSLRKHGRPSGHLFTTNRSRFALLLLAWLPWVVLIFPGFYTFDTSLQLAQFFGNPQLDVSPAAETGAFTDHHPIMTTLYMGVFVWVGQLFGVAFLGFALLCIVQTLCYATAIVFLLSQFELKGGLSARVVKAGLFLFAFNPILPFLCWMPCKDTIFGWLFIFFLGFMVRIAKDGVESFASKKLFVAFVVVCVFMACAKKTGAYMVLLAGLVLLVMYRRKILKLLAIALSGFVVVALVLPNTVFLLLDVKPGAKIEMLGPLCQQTARYAAYHSDDVTDSEREAIDALLGYDTLPSRYSPTIVDNVIHDFDVVDITPSNEKLLNYLQAYLSQGLRHPGCYFNATAAMESGWFDVSQRIQVQQAYMQLTPDNGLPDINIPGVCWTAGTIATKLMNFVATLPGVDLLACPTLYVGLVPLLAWAIMLYRGVEARRIATVLLPWLCCVPFLLLSPVSNVAENTEAFRYLIPFVLMAPYLLLSAVSFDESPDDHGLSKIEAGEATSCEA